MGNLESNKDAFFAFLDFGGEARNQCYKCNLRHKLLNNVVKQKI